MKKILIALIALTGFSIAGIAQGVPDKKAGASKMQTVKNSTPKKADPKMVTVTKVAPAASKTVLITKPAAVIKTNTAAPLKKDGTPDKRFKTSTVKAARPLKKDGTPDMRFKANKKH